jgi:hypothetical protein
MLPRSGVLGVSPRGGEVYAVEIKEEGRTGVCG